jgi:hypothetical protein
MVKLLKPIHHSYAFFEDGHKERIYYINEHPEGHIEFCTESGKYVYAKPPGAYILETDIYRVYAKPPECYAFYKVVTMVTAWGGIDEVYHNTTITEIRIVD